MENDPRLALQLAFQHLNTFSVPGVGTFKKSRFPAKIDSESGKISPPGEKFVHASGEKHVAELEAFYKSHFKLSAAKTKEMVDAVKLWLMRGLKGGGRIKLDGVGTMELTGGKVLNFEPEDSLEAQGADFFGLQEVDFEGGKKEEKGKGALAAAAAVVGAGVVAAAAGGETGGKEKPKAKEEKGKSEAKPKAKEEKPKPEEQPKAKPNLEKKKAAAVAATPPVVQPPVQTPPAQEPPAEKKKRRGLGWIILALLLIGIAVAGFIWKDEVNHQLVQWGLLDGDNGNDNPIVDNDSSGTDTDSSDTALNNIEPIDSVYEEDLVMTSGDYPDEGAPTENDPNVGSFAAPGQYYLIVGSTYNSEQALRLARQVGGKIIKPRYKGNYYRIYVDKGASKDDVIAQMVAKKEQFPNSWIFWLGM